MINKKIKIEQFKRECKSIHFYDLVIEEYNDKINHIDCVLDSLEYTNENYVKQLILDQDQMLIEKADYERRKKAIMDKISTIGNDDDRQMLVDAFIHQLYYKKLINKYHFNDSSALYRHINRIIEKIIL